MGFRTLALPAFLLFPLWGSAADLDGVNLEDDVFVDGDGRPLGPRIWLGERPVQDDLKEILLGQRQTVAN